MALEKKLKNKGTTRKKFNGMEYVYWPLFLIIRSMFNVYTSRRGRWPRTLDLDKCLEVVQNGSNKNQEDITSVRNLKWETILSSNHGIVR